MLARQNDELKASLAAAKSEVKRLQHKAEQMAEQLKRQSNNQLPFAGKIRHNSTKKC